MFYILKLIFNRDIIFVKVGGKMEEILNYLITVDDECKKKFQ